MSKSSETSKAPTTDVQTQQTVWMFSNGFRVESFELEVYERGHDGCLKFLESIRRNVLPEQLLKSKYYGGSNVEYRFQDNIKNLGTSLAWREYESSSIELQEYDSNWKKIYQEESNRIKDSLKDQAQPLLIDMEHIGSTSVEGMCSKPIIDIVIIVGHYRGDATEVLCETIDNLIKMGYKQRYPRNWKEPMEWFSWYMDDGLLIKKGFIIHMVDETKATNFIIFREYLRTHPEARRNYCEHKKATVVKQYHRTIEAYAKGKNEFVNDLLDKANDWFRNEVHCVHIGIFDEGKKQWSCCNAKKSEQSRMSGYFKYSQEGCYQMGLKKERYHPGRYYCVDYNFVAGWWTCCSQGACSDGCINVIVLENGEVLLGNCEKWDVETVYRWIRSLAQINKDYSESFRTHGITGRTLLSDVDDDILQDLGVSILLHRKLFLKAIHELKTKVSLLTTNTTPAVTSSFAGLLSGQTTSKEAYYTNFEGDFTPFLSQNEMSESSNYHNVSVCQLTNQKNRDTISRLYNWLGSLPNRYKIDTIEFVFNPGRYRMFLGHLELIENRQQQPAFQPNLDTENSRAERESVLERLDSLCQQVSHNRKARIVRMWHGCRRSVLPHLLSDGFATLGTLDDGWYGKAMYFTSSAKYATRYCGESGGCLIMCYVLLLNPFPVVSADAPLTVSPSRFRFYGKGNYKNYQCHYIPVSPVSTNASTMDYRPPETGTDDAIYDELAVFQEATILPQIVVYFK